jgi:LacI family transcriptional regulator
MTTMADVARAAKVSTTTVSHVLNATRPVSPRTQERVLAAVERTGYSQNTIARSLARSRTQSLGLAVSGLANPSFAAVVAAIEAVAGRAGYTLLLADTHDDPELERRTVRSLVDRRVDGLVLSPSARAAEDTLPFLEAQSLPVVLIDRLVSPAFDQVGSEGEQATAQLVDHLAGHGHRRIGLVVGAPELATMAERIAGYEAGLRRNGLAADPALVAAGGAVGEHAREATAGLLALPSPPTALVSASNTLTIGLMRAIADRGLAVPGDVAVAAFDDFEWADLFAPRLTVVAQPTEALGRTAVELLLARIEDPARPPRTIRLPSSFVCRDSCGPHPQDTAGVRSASRMKTSARA